MRTEFGISGAISMSDLYRGGSEVPSTAEATNAFSSVTEGYSVISGSVTYGSSSAWGQEGYTQRWNHGDLNDWSFSNTTNQNFYGGRYPRQYGYFKNGEGASSDLQSLDASNGGGTRAGTYGYYINNGGVTPANYPTPDNVLDMTCTCDNGLVQEHSLTCTVGRAGDYYIWNYSAGSQGFMRVEIDTGSGFSEVYSLTGISSSGYVKRHDATGMTVGDKIRVVLRGSGESIMYSAQISTSSSTAFDKTVPTNTSVPESGEIEFEDLYGAEA